jgi:hypothetical protein
LRLDDLEARFAARRAQGLRRNLEITDEGVLLGAGTLLAGLALDGEEARILTVLSVAFACAVSPQILDILGKAIALWKGGEKFRAQLHLTYARLPPLTEEQAFALCAADELLKEGMTPRALMKGLGLDPAALDALEKYNPDQPRVPAGNGSASGRWGSGGGAGGAAPKLIGHGRALSDISVKPAGPTVQVAQSVTARDLPDGTPVAPYGERVVSFKNLPMNARQILQYRVFSQDDVTKEWRIGMDLPMPESEVRKTKKTRGLGAGIDDSGLVFSPPGSPPLPDENSGKEPQSGVRYGNWNLYTGQPYFKVFNDDAQAISPITGRTVPRKSPEAHYPVDPVRSWTGSAFNALLHGLFGGR